ncbi:MAG: molybdenum cofactor guanylyltransferase [Dehalococcoidales bacterium]|nr:molybdenum cofactor guanylyltransferase [Dehalococcoidales bacterium]
MDVSCIILAGGKSSRLGRNKVLEKLGESSLLERVIDSLKSFESEILVVAARDSDLPKLADYTGLRVVEDVHPGKGSLGGVYTGIKLSKTIYNLVVACDMPFLNVGLLRYMLGLADSYDVVIPRTNEGVLEPLHAVYSRNCLNPIEFLIKQDRLSILELFPMVKVRYVDNSQIDRFDLKHLSFFNINTEAELHLGRELLERGIEN